MALKDEKRHSIRELRLFGFTLGATLAAVFGGLLPWAEHRPIPLLPFAAAGGVWVLAPGGPARLAPLPFALS